VSSDDRADELVVTIGQKPSNPSASAAATFSFSAEGASGFECELDHRAFKSCSSSVRFQDLDEGRHTFRVRAIGKEEHGPAARFVWRVDLTAPTTTITDGPRHRTAETSAAFSFAANEDVRGFECKLDDGPFSGCTSPANFLGPLEDGTYAFAVRAIDLAGNVGDAEGYRWRVSTDRKTTVPTIVGLRLARGIEALADARLRWETEKAASRLPVGEIVDQDPAAGDDVPVGSTVTVVVSAGIEIAVPRVLGLAEGRAVSELEQAGLEASVVPALSSTVPEGHVSAQKPDPGTEVTLGATVEITVSLGYRRSDLTVEILENGVEVACPAGNGSCITTVTFTVRNVGRGDTGESFEVLVSANPDERMTVTLRGGLAGGERAVFTRTLGPGGNCFNPDCSVRVVADPDGRVPELDEKNNVATWHGLG
jgi:transcription elongation GreA/GreB family factor